MELAVLIFFMAFIGLACLAFVALLPFAIKELCRSLARERWFESLLDQREPLSDEAFYHAFYDGTGIDPQVPIRLRKLIARELGSAWINLHPHDCPAAVYDDLDDAELVYDAEAEFGVKVSLTELQSLDGTFDSLVRLLDAKLKAQKTSATWPR